MKRVCSFRVGYCIPQKWGGSTIYMDPRSLKDKYDDTLFNVSSGIIFNCILSRWVMSAIFMPHEGAWHYIPNGQVRHASND
jgi:hypothetical protein